MLKNLAKLSIISHAGFGLHCFNTLKDLMCSGREMENNVIKVLSDEIIKLMEINKNPKNIPVTLLEGLHSLVDYTQETAMLKDLYKESFPYWLKCISSLIEDAASTESIFPDDPHYDAIIKLVSASV